jgi:hypothetical protein
MADQIEPRAGTQHRDIKALTVGMERFKPEFPNQQYMLCQFVFPEDAKEVKMSNARWTKNKVGIRVIGVFPSTEAANLYIASLHKVGENDAMAFDTFVVSMYEWIEIPPDEEVPDLATMDQSTDIDVGRSQPLLSEYMGGLQKKKNEEKMLMEMRMQMAKDKREGVNKVMTKEHEKWFEENTIKQLQDILAEPDDYPDVMIADAKTKLAALEHKVKNLRILFEIIEEDDDGNITIRDHQHADVTVNYVIDDVLTNHEIYPEAILEKVRELKKKCGCIEE